VKKKEGTSFRIREGTLLPQEGRCTPKKREGRRSTPVLLLKSWSLLFKEEGFCGIGGVGRREKGGGPSSNVECLARERSGERNTEKGEFLLPAERGWSFLANLGGGLDKMLTSWGHPRERRGKEQSLPRDLGERWRLGG